MPAGIQVRNDAGALQIDETFINYVLVDKGSATASTHYFTGGGTSAPQVYRVDVTVTDRTAPMLAIRSAGAVYVERVTVSGSSWTWRVLATSGATFDWFCFDLAPAGSSDHFGMEIFNAAGATVYHTSQKPLRVAGEFGYGGGDGATYDSVAAIALTSGRSYAAITLRQGAGEWVQEDVTDQVGNWYSGWEAGAAFIRYARIKRAWSNNTTTGGGVNEFQEARCLAIDVTNY